MVRLTKRNALAHEVIGQFSSIQKAFGKRCAHALGMEGDSLQHLGHERQGMAQRAVAVDKWLFVFLKIAVIREGQARVGIHHLVPCGQGDGMASCRVPLHGGCMARIDVGRALSHQADLKADRKSVV